MADHEHTTPPSMVNAAPLTSGGTSRRSLAGGAVLALLGAAAVTRSARAETHLDAGLLADLAIIQEIDRRSDELYEACSEYLLDHPSWKPYDAHTAATMPMWHAAVDRMVHTEAKTADGMRAKAMVALPLLDHNGDGSPPEEFSEALAWSLCRDLIEGRTAA